MRTGHRLGDGSLRVFPKQGGDRLHVRQYRNILWNEKTWAVRSRISSKLIFARCVRYLDRTYDGFYVNSSGMFVLTKGDILWQLWDAVREVYATIITFIGRNLVRERHQLEVNTQRHTFFPDKGTDSKWNTKRKKHFGWYGREYRRGGAVQQLSSLRSKAPYCPILR